ncbi:MAG: hypothetical protein CMJ90_15770 [Planctomycetes bacterium]|nr:hypothetical protein [Planctomycetota bacterium]
MGGRRTFWIALGAVLVLGIHPLLRVIAEAAGDADAFWLTVTSPETRNSLWTTIQLGVATTSIAVLVGTTLAWLSTRTDLPGQRWLGTILTIPYIVPPYISAVAWINLANPEVGILNTWLGPGTLDIYTFGGIAWVLALSFYPYVYLTVRAALKNADPSLEDAARMSGAGTWRVLRDVSLPLMRPAIATSGGLVLMATVSAFGAPALLDAHRRVPVLSTRIYESLTSDLDGIHYASSLATLLFLFALVPMLVPTARHAVLTGKASRPSLVRLGRSRGPVIGLVLLFVIAAVVLPALAVCGTAFLRIAGDFSFDNLTLDNFRVLSRPESTEAIGNSLWLGVCAATIAVLLGGAIAFIQIRTRHRGRSALAALATIPLATPGTVLAIGLLLAWTRPIDLRNTAWILLAAYVAKYVALASRAIGEGLGTVDTALAEAARMSGARSWFRLRTVWIPLALPSIVAGWFLVFMPSFSELTMSLILVGPGLDTIGTRMFELQEYEGPVAASALATVVLGLVVFSNVLVKALSKGRYGI